MRLIALVAIVLSSPVLRADRPDNKAKAKPHPKSGIIISKETTWFLAPVTKAGYIDYAAALNKRMKKGITTKNNAGVEIILTTRLQREGTEEVLAIYCTQLGIPVPPKKGDYLTPLDVYLKRTNPKKFGGDDNAKVLQQTLEGWYKAMDQPWTAQKYPEVAAWLKSNEKHLTRLQTAVQRPRLYYPMAVIGDRKKSPALIGVVLPAIQLHREIARVFATRAYMNIAAGDYDGAEADILAIRRLGRLSRQEPFLISGLVGIAIESISQSVEHEYLVHVTQNAAKIGKPKAAQRIAAFRAKAKKVPKGRFVVDVIDQTERCMSLDATQWLSQHGGIGALHKFIGGGGAGQNGVVVAAEKVLGKKAMDWNSVMRLLNKSYDRYVASARIKDRTKRQKAFDELEADLKRRVIGARDIKRWAAGVLGGNVRKVVSDQIGNVLISLLMPALRKCTEAEERTDTREDLMDVSAALARYHIAKGSYPRNLAQLKPTYLKSIPQDRFSGKALIYKQTKSGFNLYSVGVNGKDDNGVLGVRGGKGGDDPAVSVPIFRND